MIGHNDAQKDENGSRKGDGREGLMEDQNRAKQRHQRLCIHIIAGSHDVEFAQYHVPREETTEASHYAKEDEIDPHNGLREGRQMKCFITLHDHHWQHRDEPVEEDLSCEKEGVVSAIEGTQDDSVDSPAEGGTKGEQVTNRIDLNKEIAIEHHKRLSHQSDERTDDKLTGELNLAEQEDGEQ